MCATGKCSQCQFNAAIQNQNIYGQGQYQLNTVTTTGTGALGNILWGGLAQAGAQQVLGNQQALGQQVLGNQQALGQSQWNGTIPVSKIKKRCYWGKIVDPISGAESKITKIEAGYFFMSNDSTMLTENITIEGELATTIKNKDHPLKFVDWEEKEILLKCLNTADGKLAGTLQVVEVDNLEYLELICDFNHKEENVAN